MLLELMSNGTLAELPPENIPSGLELPDESSIMLLLPHNKYLLGTGSGKWIYASDKPGTNPQNVFLYDDEMLSLLNDGAQPTILPAKTVNALRQKLLHNTEPPGTHITTILMLRTCMRDHPVFNMDNDNFSLDENFFALEMKKDITLYRAYWTLRFSLARNEMETVGRIKAWLKADPENFRKPEHVAKLWFSILELPEQDALNELEELSFSRLELQRISRQYISPLVVYNPKSGWLILGRFGRDKNIMFLAWVFLNHELWTELRDHKKLSVHDIILAVWGEYETQQAIVERAKYKGEV